MWTVIKFDKKKYNLLKSQLKEKLGEDFEIYCPKSTFQRFKNNKLIRKEFNLLGDYLFCFHDKFSEKNYLNQIKYFKGVNQLLEGYLKSQNEIRDFIKKCKDLEGVDGYISQTFFEIKKNKFYKFSSGPFTQKIFKIIEIQKNKLKILMGNFSTTIDRKQYLVKPL